MGVRLWQVCASAAIVVTLAIVLGDLLNADVSGGYYGLHMRERGNIVASVSPGSPAARVGIEAGDKLTVDGDLTSRVRFTRPVAGDRVIVADERDGSTRAVTLVAVGTGKQTGVGSAILVTYETLRIVMIALALLIVVRRPDLRAARALANFFIAFAYGFIGRTPWYPPIVTALLDITRPAAVFYALEQAAIFAAIFPRPSSGGLRRFAERVCPYLLAVAAPLGIVTFFLYYFSGIDLPIDPNIVFGTYTLLMIALIAIGFILGTREATPAERHRLHWISFSLAIGFAGLLTGVAFEATGAPEERWIFLPLSLIAVPIGTTYAILRHRVLDVGFVVNRALVFGVISGIVVLAFGLLEWFLGKYLVDLGHVGSSFVEAMLALALALSLRQIHGRVDHFVDSVFFRQRHLAERALRRLAHEVAFIDNAGVLGAGRSRPSTTTRVRPVARSISARANGNSCSVSRRSRRPNASTRTTLPSWQCARSTSPSISTTRASRARGSPALSPFQWSCAASWSACSTAAPSASSNRTIRTSARRCRCSLVRSVTPTTQSAQTRCAARSIAPSRATAPWTTCAPCARN